MGIIIKSPEEIGIMRQGGRILASILKRLSEEVRPGVRTRELDEIGVQEMKKYDVKSPFKGYRGYPANICVSIQDELVHGIPGERVINKGEVVTLDAGVIYRGFMVDAAVTVAAGEITAEARSLVEATREALEAGIKAARSGARLGDVSSAIQVYAESRGLGVVREYSGHGVGRELHEDPQIPNFGVAGRGPVLRRGMTLALEPMLTAGDWRTRVLDNMWTVVTQDGSLCAHFEHTIAIGDNEAEVLTSLG
ncbi:MAG: type I methionyl aminopeptidase [Chloroflexi bacterium]|nr:type I methionyl aminopeptidase [Chloroflexota bacterium]